MYFRIFSYLLLVFSLLAVFPPIVHFYPCSGRMRAVQSTAPCCTPLRQIEATNRCANGEGGSTSDVPVNAAGAAPSSVDPALDCVLYYGEVPETIRVVFVESDACARYCNSHERLLARAARPLQRTVKPEAEWTDRIAVDLIKNQVQAATDTDEASVKHVEHDEVACGVHVSESERALEEARTLQAPNAKAAVARKVTCPKTHAAPGSVSTGRSPRKPPAFCLPLLLPFEYSRGFEGTF